MDKAQGLWWQMKAIAASFNNEIRYGLLCLTISSLFIAQLLTKVTSCVETIYSGLFEVGSAVRDSISFLLIAQPSTKSCERLRSHTPFSNSFYKFSNAGSPQLSIEYNRFVAVESLYCFLTALACSSI